MLTIRQETVSEVSVDAIAKALAASAADDFKSLFFKLNELLSEQQLDEIAKEMSYHHGSNCQKPLFRLVKLIEYHSEAGNRAEQKSLQRPGR